VIDFKRIEQLTRPVMGAFILPSSTRVVVLLEEIFRYKYELFCRDLMTRLYDNRFSGFISLLLK